MAGTTEPLKIAPVTLTGRFVRLEPLTRAHVPALAHVAFDPSLWRWTTTAVENETELERYVDEALALERAGSALPFATFHLADGVFVGSTRFGSISVRDGRLEIGWTWVGVPYQRTTVNTEAKYLMLRHAFDTLGATRVELKTHEGNEKSRNAMLRIGAKFEGIHRKHMLQPDGTRRNTAWYSVVDDEWPAVKARLEAMLAEVRPPRR